MNLRIKIGLLFLCTFSGINMAAQEPAAEGRVITPAGSLVLDVGTRLPAVGSMTLAIHRSPDNLGHEGKGRYLLVVNSGFGVQFSESTKDAEQSIAVMDLNASPEPLVIQNVYFPSPQSVNVGIAFSARPNSAGVYDLYVSGGFENKVWNFHFNPKAATPIDPASPGPSTKVKAEFFEISDPGEKSPADYNKGKAALYPTGISLAPDGNTLITANNLDDSITIIRNLHGARQMERLNLHHPGKPTQNIYPYGVVTLGTGMNARAYVSCWNDSSLVVISLSRKSSVKKYISLDRHPTAILANADGSRIFVANSNADTVSVVDAQKDEEIERINVRLSEEALIGASPEGLALSDDGATLFVANAHSNALAVVSLGAVARGAKHGQQNELPHNSRILGFIPTGQYPSAVAFADGKLFIANGKGTGVEASSMRVNNSGRTPNTPNAAFPANKEKNRQGGQYSGSIVSGNISMLALPDPPTLARYTQQTLQNDGLIGFAPPKLFPAQNPIKHVIYVIKENRTYDQVFGDLKTSGDGHPADGDPSLAIFGNGEAASRPNGARQTVTPNHHALAERFGLFDRFFVNSEASPDGHNWATAAFSTDYVDKGFRWAYSGRGRTYDWEGFNRLPDYEPPGELGVAKFKGDVLEALTDLLVKHVPYRQGFMDLAEPKTLYLWDAAARAGLSYRNYGEFVVVISQRDVEAAAHKAHKDYPDLSSAVRAVPTKQSLENHHSLSFHSFDLTAPDSFTSNCYTAALNPASHSDPAVTRTNPNPDCRGNSRFGEWLAEFQAFVSDREAGRGDPMPSLTVMRFPNDHTAGLKSGLPTPQFFLADNDYAVGRLVEAVSSSPYWKDTAIFIIEDDAQSGPDHVDSHRSVALAISAYNRPRALIHNFHNTVSMIRTIELLLGIAPMNQLDSSAVPMDIFQEIPDLTPYTAVLPVIAADNLLTQKPKDKLSAEWMKKSSQQDFRHADMADPAVLNSIIWFACRGGGSVMPAPGQLPVYQAMRLGISESLLQSNVRSKKDDDD